MFCVSAASRLRCRDVRRSEGCLHLVHHSCTVQAAFLVSATFAGRNPLGSPAKPARTHLACLEAANRRRARTARRCCGVRRGQHACQRPRGHAGTRAPRGGRGRRPSRLSPVARLAAKHTAARLAKYTVKSGDTLSAIAERVYKNPGFWPVLYWANHSQIRYANMIEVGQVLAVPARPAHIPNAPSVLGPTPPPAPVTTSAPATGYGQSSAPTYTAPTYTAQAAPGAGLGLLLRGRRVPVVRYRP